MNKQSKSFMLGMFAVMVSFFAIYINSYAGTLTTDYEAVSPDLDGKYTVSFTLDDGKAHAGNEFCISCSDGVSIENVTYSEQVSSTAPTVARGFTWFGYYDSENRFDEPISVNMTICLDKEKITEEETPHIIFASYKTYLIEDFSYKTEEQLVDKLIYLQQIDEEGTVMSPVELRSPDTETVEIRSDESATPKMNILPVVVMGVCIFAGVAFIYIIQMRRRRRKEEQNA